MQIEGHVQQFQHNESDNFVDFSTFESNMKTNKVRAQLLQWTLSKIPISTKIIMILSKSTEALHAIIITRLIIIISLFQLGFLTVKHTTVYFHLDFISDSRLCRIID